MNLGKSIVSCGLIRLQGSPALWFTCTLGSSQHQSYLASMQVIPQDVDPAGPSISPYIPLGEPLTRGQRSREA
jgi:hypothetical protein